MASVATQTVTPKCDPAVYRRDLLVAALASQGLPFLGFLLPVVKSLSGM